MYSIVLPIKFQKPIYLKQNNTLPDVSTQIQTALGLQDRCFPYNIPI